MIIPSIDLMNGRAVQLVGGRDLEVDAGDPRPIADRFALVGEIAVVDLDAALGRGSNADAIESLIQRAPCRVGGGIRSVDAALRWLDAGAAKIVLGTAATPEVLSELPRERIIVALDAVEGEVVTHGWRTRTGRTVVERMRELRGLVGGFLVTFVEREGRLAGTNLDAVEELVKTAGDARVTIAGGISTTEEIALLDRLGADAQVGMALYKGSITLADAFAAPLVTDRPDNLWPTVVVDEYGIALGLVYSSRESLRRAFETRGGRVLVAPSRCLDEGRNIRGDAGAAARQRGLRSRRASLHGTPEWSVVLPPKHSHLLGPGSWPCGAGAFAGCPRGSRDAELLHPAPVRRSRPAPREVAGGGRRTRGSL